MHPVPHQICLKNKTTKVDIYCIWNDLHVVVYIHIFHQDALMIATDIKYMPSFDDVTKTADAALRYIPKNGNNEINISVL